MTKWADVFVVAPADCLTLSKLAHGHCDNLLTCALLAWPCLASEEGHLAGEKPKPLVVCPSMNTKMWAHPATRENLRLVRSFGAECVGPISKRLMCGDVGTGAMEEPAEVARKVAMAMSSFSTGLKQKKDGGQNTSENFLLYGSAAALVLGIAIMWHKALH